MPDSSTSSVSRRSANTALTLLLLINLFNYIDRQVLAAVEKSISHDLLPDDRHSLAKMGWLANAFLLSYMLLSPLFGRLANRFSRWTLVAVGVAVWSLASGATGLAATFVTLLITRCFVGIGEAAYGPTAPALISDLYPVESRGKVLSMFYVAIPVGSALGYILGGAIAHSLSWRWSFYAVVPPGLILAAWAFFMKDPRVRSSALGVRSSGNANTRSAADSSPPNAELRTPNSDPQHSLTRDLRALLHNRSYILDTIGMTFMTFAMGGIAFFMPRYIIETAHLDEGKANLYFGAIVVVAGLAATIAGGITGDAMRSKFPGSYFLVSAAGLALGFPLFLAVLYTPFPLAWLFVFLAVFCLFFNTGPSNTILANVTPSHLRATAFAVNILIIHALGDAISPVVIGAIADAKSLRAGFVVVSITFLLGAVAWAIGAPYLAKDTEKANAEG